MDTKINARWAYAALTSLATTADGLTLPESQIPQEQPCQPGPLSTLVTNPVNEFYDKEAKQNRLTRASNLPMHMLKPQVLTGSHCLRCVTTSISKVELERPQVSENLMLQATALQDGAGGGLGACCARKRQSAGGEQNRCSHSSLHWHFELGFGSDQRISLPTLVWRLAVLIMSHEQHTGSCLNLQLEAPVLRW